MDDFATLCRDAGMNIAEVASEFGVASEVAERWQEGTIKPPTQVTRTLDLLKNFSHPMPLSPPRTLKDSRSGTFTDNMKLPIHRWFRYSAGFSAQWVESVIEQRAKSAPCNLLLDPFAGSGTALLAAQRAGIRSIGIEPHPFIHAVACTKLGWHVNASELSKQADLLIQNAQCSSANYLPADAAPLLGKCFHPDALVQLYALRHEVESLECIAPIAALLRLALTSVLRECSHVGTAQWQYVLPNKSKAKTANPFAAFAARIEMFVGDIRQMQSSRGYAPAEVWSTDARSPDVPTDVSGQVDLIVTSPPYPNNYDYADATRLEMTFWGEVQGWGDLQSAVRHKLLRSCSQHSAAEKLDLDVLLTNPLIDPIRAELTEVCRELAEVRLEKGGKKTYHTMVAAYFCDLAQVWRSMRKFAAPRSDVCFVIGDSAPYGVYVPADEWLTKLALAAGFYEPRFEKLRDRNVKWKNRKHRVPLKEGNLWLRG
jgi:hypothetical protein